MRVLFWGTPEFALPSLRALESEGHAVMGVVTQPDKPAGRGRKLRASPVKLQALEEGYDILQPERPRGKDFMARVRALKPDVSVVVAYGHILTQEVLDLPSVGSINVHASYLPELRGAAPVNWAIVRGHHTTGVTVMRMVRAMDAGPILMQAQEPIYPRDSATSLAARLSEIGAELLVEVLALMEVGEAEETEQDHERATYAPKVNREVARIDWSLPRDDVSNHIRGMDSVPGAWSLLDEQPVKLFQSEVERGVPRPPDATTPPGTVLAADPEGGLRVACGLGWVTVLEVQPPGKRRMTAADWVRGRGVHVGQRFV